MRGRDDEWTDLMRSANAGDSVAYHRLLSRLRPCCVPERGTGWHGPASRPIRPRILCRTFCWRCI